MKFQRGIRNHSPPVLDDYENPYDDSYTIPCNKSSYVRLQNRSKLDNIFVDDYYPDTSDDSLHFENCRCVNVDFTQTGLYLTSEDLERRIRIDAWEKLRSQANMIYLHKTYRNTSNIVSTLTHLRKVLVDQSLLYQHELYSPEVSAGHFIHGPQIIVDIYHGSNLSEEIERAKRQSIDIANEVIRKSSLKADTPVIYLVSPDRTRCKKRLIY